MKKCVSRTQMVPFTLIELLTCVTIIAILAAILLPALTRARYVAQEVVCGNNLKQQVLGLSNYASNNDMRYPQRGVFRNGLHQMREFTAYDIRPIMLGPDFGGERGIFECPLAAGPGAWGDNSGSSGSNYDMYFTASLQGQIGGLGERVIQRDTNGKIRYTPISGDSKDSRYYHALRGAMRKVGQSWRYASNNSDRGKRFSLLLADRTGGGAYHGQGRNRWSNHKGWGPAPSSGWVRVKDSWGSAPGSYEYPSIEANFVGTDGHIEKHRIPGNGLHTSDFTTMRLSFVPYSFLEEE